MRPCVVGVLLLVSSVAQANSFTVDNATISDATGEKIIEYFYPQLSNQGYGHDVASAFNSNVTPYLQTFAGIINTTLNDIRTQRFLGAMSNASAGAAKMFPMDQGTDPSLLSLSVGLGGVGNITDGNALNALIDLLVNHNLLGSAQQELPAVGGMLNVSVIVGLNMRIFELPDWGPIEWSRLTVFGNFAWFKNGFKNFQLDYKSFGVHAQYRILDQIPVVPGGVLRWGGLSVGTGFDYAKLSGSFDFTLPTSSISQTFTYQNQSLEADLSWSGTASLAAGAGAGSIPIEVMTHVQLAYVFTLYAGGALDFNFGNADINALGSAPVNIALRDPKTNRSLNVLQPSGHLTFDQSAGPTVVDVRGFVGLQLNILWTAVFAQLSVDSTHNYGVGFGARAFW